MDANPEPVGRARQRAAEALRMVLAEPPADGPGGLAGAAAQGFRQVLLTPPWEGVTRRGAFLARDFAANGASPLRETIAAASEAGLDLLLDVQIDRLAADSPLAGAPDSPFIRPNPADCLDPRLGVDADAAVARLADAEDAFALARWWTPILRGWVSQGVQGFRLRGLSAALAEAAAALVTALRQAFPDAILVIDADRLPHAILRGLEDAGIDGLSLTLPRGGTLDPWDDLAALIRVAPVLFAVSGPDAQARPETLAFAATLAQGIIAPAANLRPDELAPFTRAWQSVPVFGERSPPSLPAGEFGSIAAFYRLDAADHRSARHAALVIVNTDPVRSLTVPAATLLCPMAGAFGAFHPVAPAGAEPLGLRQQIALKPGQTRIFAATAAPRDTPDLALDTTRASQAGAWPRLGIENVSPAVDGGAFPVKAIAGEVLTVEADIVFDGHEKIAAALRIQLPGEKTWREIPMADLGNDRWQAILPLEKLGRHIYLVTAWRDRFETFRDELAKKSAAGVDVTLELAEGEALVAQAVQRRAGTPLADRLQAALDALARANPAEKVKLFLAPPLARLMAIADNRPFRVESAKIPVDAERVEARFASWYEVFPRSLSDDPARHGTFRDVERHLPRIRDMGFDVLYFPPIHPIGRINRKGRNNTLTPSPGDPGSPYAIGAEEGGHDALHPELGTLEDFAHLREAAAAHGLELAIDFAIQCSPDHPWLKQHPGWFDWRPDGSIRYAENPPKKYEDIVNVDFYAEDAIPGLWLALCDAVLFWASQGVRLFRVDNPHTKPFPFWQWMIGEVRSRFPDAIFLAEAFTRPKIMYRLAKIGFSQSYTYFTWRNTKRELEAYLTELTTGSPKDFFRPHFFVNTPDINPLFLQQSGRPGFLIRAALAATLSGLWGVYNGFELCEAAAIPGKEEYADSEKYQLRAWDWDRDGNIVPEITRLNRIRRLNPALQTHKGVTFLQAYNDAILYYEKATPDRANVVLVAVSLDPHQAQSADIEIPLWSWKLPDQAGLSVEDLLTGGRFAWHGKMQRVTLTPERPYAVWRVRPL
jgi:starch synthase (maltosyl-transferring)